MAKTSSNNQRNVKQHISHESGERALIAAIRSRAGRSGGGGLRLGIGDDCAILRPPAGHEIVVTTDLSLEQVHFRRDWHPPESVGHRCLARGLSDLAAMGSKPLGAFLSIALPPELTIREKGKSWLDRFLDGLLALADQAGVPLAGGDTAQSPSLAARGGMQSGLAAADIVLVGSVKQGRALLRSGARAGDKIYVTGNLGGAAAELLAIGRHPEKFAGAHKMQAGHPHLFPAPRILIASRLASARRIHSAIDVSDGLSTDLAHICEESGVAAEIDAEAIPIHPLALQAELDGWVASALGLALHGGEDYELLFTAAKGVQIPRRVASVEVHAIGQIVARRGRRPSIVLRQRDGKTTALESGGWEHFSAQ
ncbi:thiamine-phosphate kinase [Silvibacterium bohemicum]|uniref:thiamine-phosphate kinase n=1 Tax=Silvibacterium bohemicum TaxID=1577686 RepID=UPI00067861A6|nr:thiamine-phosphate kinase [Silvibacterium bohemicum]